MSSNDNIENNCNGQVDDLEKETRKNMAVPNVIKYSNTVLLSQDTGSHKTSLINKNTKILCHCTIYTKDSYYVLLHYTKTLCSVRFSQCIFREIPFFRF